MAAARTFREGRRLGGICHRNLQNSGGREGLYGVREYYTRVLSYCAWIDGIIAKTGSQRE